MTTIGLRGGIVRGIGEGGEGGEDWQIVPIWQHVPSPGFRPDAGHHPAAASIRNSPLMPTRTQPGPSPGRRPPPGCGFPKEQAVKVLGTGRARRNCARGPPANPKGRVLWLTTSTLPGISIDEPCLQRPSELRPPSPGFRPDASLRPAAASQRNSPLKPTHTQPRLSPGSRTPSGSSFLKKQTAKFWELVGHEKE